MTTDNAAVALAHALEALDCDPLTPNRAQLMLDDLAAQGFHLMRWNHDMSQAPRDGTPVFGFWQPHISVAVNPTCYGITLWDGIEWVSADDDTQSYSEPTAWCHLIPPPRETK